jgi:DNA polymerase III sliding clamp (beta) subunit (PCNA family)
MLDVDMAQDLKTLQEPVYESAQEFGQEQQQPQALQSQSKVWVNRKRLLEAVRIAAEVAKSRSMPILNYIKLEALPDGVLVIGTNLDIFLAIKVPIESTEQGEKAAVLIKAVLFQDLLKYLRESIIGLSFSSQALKVQAREIVYTIPSGDPEDYPALPDTPPLEGTIFLELAEVSLGRALVLLPKAQRQVREELTYVHCSFPSAHRMIVYGTDGYIAGRFQVYLDATLEQAWPDLAIFGKGVEQVLKYARKKGHPKEIRFGRGDAYVMFAVGDARFWVRTGNVLNFERIFPIESTIEITLDRLEFLQAIQELSPLCDEVIQLLVLEIEPGQGDIPGKVSLKVEETERGQAQIVLHPVNIVIREGACLPMRIGIKWTLCMKMAKGLAGNLLTLKILSPEHAIGAGSPDNPSSQYAFMPIRLG